MSIDPSPGQALSCAPTCLVRSRCLDAARAYWEGLPIGRKQSFRFLHVSTDEVYGSLGAEGAFNEDSRYDPRSPYSASKAASDHLVRAWGETYRLPVLISNCSNNYGPRQFPEKLIPLMILNSLAGKALPVYGDGLNVRDWIHVEDHVRSLVAILAHGRVGETYLVGSRSERTNLQVVRALCAAFDHLRPMAAPHDRLITSSLTGPGMIGAMQSIPRRWKGRPVGSRATTPRDRNRGNRRVVSRQRKLVGADRSGVYQGERLGLVNVG